MLDWLKDYRELEDKLIYLENKLERSKKELKRWVWGDLSKYKLTADSDGAKVEDRIEVIEYELAHKMNDMYDLKEMISKFKGLDNKIIQMKYIEGMTLEQIALDLDYSPYYIKRKHAEIRKIINFVDAL
ncbi:ECF-type sigma factor [Bacillus sp. BP-3]|uniref:ECF-type sigma factor n=1 Tax=Bacillus sp. BP-3 TaxID=3022773 RepID=UPI00232D743B|nr:ECF-type sigma factor [Bacillus sp. BP-3]MDC2863775.1 hypothetical protein [Bacillus sp. BP-3]